MTNILLTEGDWRVVRFSYEGGAYLSVQHHCTAGLSGSPIPGWVGMYYQAAQLSEPCYVCDRVPNEKIQVVFILLVWDQNE
jgi:hypothetical protein